MMKFELKPFFIPTMYLKSNKTLHVSTTYLASLVKRHDMKELPL